MTTHNSAATSRIPALGRSALLRTALKLDAAVTALNGAAYLIGAALLEDLLGLPPNPLRAIGAFLVVYGAIVWYVGTRPQISRRAAWAVVAVNAVWAVDSVVVAAFGWGVPTAAGTGWIVLQALVVGGFAVLQRTGLKLTASA